MNELWRARSTTGVSQPVWAESGFTDETAQGFWEELPEALQRHALAELAAGNRVIQILRNEERGVVLLAFERGPLIASPPSGVIVHTEHRYGNYCYDGTRFTYEHQESGSFLAFDDPDWQNQGEV